MGSQQRQDENLDLQTPMGWPSWDGKAMRQDFFLRGTEEGAISLGGCQPAMVVGNSLARKAEKQVPAQGSTGVKAD